MADQEQLAGNAAQHDEINLFELVQAIWDGRWLVALVTAVAAVFGMLYVAVVPQEWQGELEIKPQTPAYLSEFGPLNSIPEITKPVIEGGQITGYEDIVTSDSLHQDFLFELERKSALRDAIAEYSSEYKDAAASEKEARRDEIADRYTVVRSVRDAPYPILRFSTEERQEAVDIVSATLARVGETVQRNLLEEISNLSKSIDLTNRAEIVELESEIEVLKAQYDRKITNRIAYLEEQAAIARELDIKKNSIEAFQNPGPGSIGISVGSELPFYMRGYSAIEKEIALLKARDPENAEVYIGEIAEIRSKLERLEHDRKVQAIDTATDITPLAAGEFSPVVYDISLIDYDKRGSPLLVIALALILGGMIGVLIVLFRTGYASYRVAQAKG